MPDGSQRTQKTRSLVEPPRWIYARTIYENKGATLDDFREAVTTLEETARIARRVFGGAHPFVEQVEHFLRESRGLLHKKRKTSG